MTQPCQLCTSSGGELIWQSQLYRVVLVEEAGYPGFCRVILNRHVAEMSDLPVDERQLLMTVVWAVEETLRSQLQPNKINLASLGNVVPHLHWHVIPRWTDDPHYPAPIWASPVRPVPERQCDLAGLKALLASKLLMLESFAKD